MDIIQNMLAQLLDNRNNDETGSHHNEEENHNNNEPPKTEQSNKVSSTDAKVIKGIQAHIASLTQREELKKVRMTRPYPLESDSVPYSPKFKPPTVHTYDGKSSPNQHINYFRSQKGNVIENDAIIVRLFINTLKGVAFNWFKSLPSGSINSWVDLKIRFLSRFIPRLPWTSSSRWYRGEENMSGTYREVPQPFSHVSFRHAFAHIAPNMHA